VVRSLHPTGLAGVNQFRLISGPSHGIDEKFGCRSLAQRAIRSKHGDAWTFDFFDLSRPKMKVLKFLWFAHIDDLHSFLACKFRQFWDVGNELMQAVDQAVAVFERLVQLRTQRVGNDSSLGREAHYTVGRRDRRLLS